MTNWGGAAGGNRPDDDDTMELPIFREVEAAWFRTTPADRGPTVADPPAWAGSDEPPGSMRSAGTDGARTRPARAAGWLADTVARGVPPPCRERYREEFHAELYELAAAGATRWRQLLYGLCVLWQLPSLRAELRAPNRAKP